MPDRSTKTLLNLLTGCIVLLGVAVTGATAQAQGYPGGPPGPPPQQSAAPGGNPICVRLEGQLATIDRGGGDPARAEQVRRYEEAAARQQGELDRVTSQAKRMGCDSTGFFSLFNGQSAQCGPVNTQIQQMRANLDQITVSLERLRGGGGNVERDNQRRSVLVALAQNNCGPQYAAAARNGGGFLNNLFGGGNTNPDAPPGEPAPAPVEGGPPSGTYRTVCVRACDGYYFPISFATVQSRFADDEKTCKNLCPATEANLFSYRNPGEDMNAAVSISGQPYSSSPNAFKYRTEFNPSCACKAAGQTWSDALKSIDDKASEGDIIVTEERAKKMSQPQTKPVPTAQKKAAPAAATAPAPAANAPADATAGTGDKSIRSVGPTFIPAR